MASSALKADADIKVDALEFSWKESELPAS